MSYSEKYGYTPDREAIGRAIEMIAANMETIASEQVYKEFYMDSETKLHIALSKDDKIIGLIESNSESDSFAFPNTKSVNVGEVYVIPEYRGSSLSKDLLYFAVEYEKQKGAGYLWVGHGTANPNARGFWNKYFKTYQYELVRKIEKY